MNLGASVDAAVDSGFDIVCAPCAYRAIYDRAREREKQRRLAAIDNGWCWLLARNIDIVSHPRQAEPVMIAFDEWRAFRAHLQDLDEQQTAAKNVSSVVHIA